MIDFTSEDNICYNNYDINLNNSLDSLNILGNVNFQNFKFEEIIHEELNKKDDLNNPININEFTEQNLGKISGKNYTQIKNKIFNITKKQKKAKKKNANKSSKKINIKTKNKINISTRKKRKINISNNKIFIPDKYIKRIRIKLLNLIVDFINTKIKIFPINIGKSICKKQFLKINKKVLYHSLVEYDKEFLNKKLKEILSSINVKYTNYLRTKNKDLIEYLINLEDKGKYFNELFELTFLDCLEHIRGTKNSELLNGLSNIDNILINEKKNLSKFELDKLKKFIMNYEQCVKSKKQRNRKIK